MPPRTRTTTPAGATAPPASGPAPSPAPSAGEGAPRASVGRLVSYRLDAGDVDAIAGRRGRLVTYVRTGRGTVAPEPLIGGAEPVEGQALPLLVVALAVDEETGEQLLSGHVFLDASDTLHVQRRRRGVEPGCWSTLVED